VPGVRTIPLRSNRIGWWNKLELFRQGLFDGPVVYADLDTLIVRDVTDICTRRYDFASICDVSSSATPGETVLNSGFMAWDGTQDLSHIYDAFSLDAITPYEVRGNWRRWGDQGFIQDHLGRPFEKLQDVWPDRFVHYKTQVRGPNKALGTVPRNASVVLFSGRPRPHEIGWEIPLEH
jgi:hypothetical protein